MSFLYHLIPAVVFGLCLCVCFLLRKKSNTIVLKIVCMVLLTLKIAQYIWRNANGNFSLPIEISSVSYFLVSIIYIFQIKKLYSVGSFFGLFTGLIYFVSYIFAGFLFSDKISLLSLVYACFSHGSMLIIGSYLFLQNKFDQQDKYKVWITTLAMVCWAMIFYTFNVGGTTFIYYVITPKFLMFSSIQLINAAIYMAYYTVIVLLFYMIIEGFYKFSNRYWKRRDK